jgi:hypothetical protein
MLEESMERSTAFLGARTCVEKGEQDFCTLHTQIIPKDRTRHLPGVLSVRITNRLSITRPNVVLSRAASHLGAQKAHTW